MNAERGVLARGDASDADLAREADRLLSVNTERMTYKQKRKNADAYMRIRREQELRAALSRAERVS